MATFEWVVLELSPQGEDEDPEALHLALTRTIKGKGVEIFIPASISIVGESRVIHKLIDNYVFVRRTLPDTAYFKLEGTRYVASILTARKSGAGRQIACIKDDDVERMRRQIHVETEQGIDVGDEVQVMNGPYKGINGRIIEEIQETDSVQVFIKLRSQQAIVTLPRSFLRFVAKDQSDLPTFSPFGTKIARIHEWVEKIRPILSWPSKAFNPIARYMRWVEQSRQLYTLLKDPPIPRAFVGVFDKVRQLNGWVEKAPALFEFLALDAHAPSVASISAKVEAKLQELQWRQSVNQRFESLTRSLENVERALMDYPSDTFDSVIIDGHNLAYRVAFALGAMKTPLSDREGNPTGLIYGFLKSLAGIKKRFEKATLYVVWDGSPMRRVRLFEGYKAERRKKREANGTVQPGQSDNQMSRLKAILPLLGVVQAFNAEEETDDVIACLVRGKLKGWRNLILSTDRDFLQLITFTDMVLCPKVGNRQEVLYDRDKVVEEYGVTPERMVQLRALLGDSSDNIPGVPRVPQKVLTALLNTHGSIEGVLSSNLAGTTQGQYEKIRSSESQIRLNVQLMSLRDDLSFEETAPKPDEAAVVEVLGSLDMQTESIVGPFFQQTPAKGFSKRA